MPSPDDRTIHAQSQISFSAELTPEQVAMFEEWDALVPTIYFMDICAVNITKMSAAKLANDRRKSYWADQFRKLDRKQHAFSYLLALLEKGSDPRDHMSKEAWVEQIYRDVASLRQFFHHARVYETDQILDDFIKILPGNPIELKRQAYLEFLRAANDEFKLSDPVAPKKRLATTSNILRKADDLSIPRQHAIVLVTIAKLYGNEDARKILKFTKNPVDFQPENSLADIMMITRFYERKIQIEDAANRGEAPYRRAKLLTDDEGLLRVARCIEPVSLQYRSTGDTHEILLDVKVKLAKLLTGLGGDNEGTEYNRIYAMIFGDEGGTE
ncbi:hypothetical protein [Acetobacter persici]|uniref:Uncharacterized protein n=1 Tax=Acetobacter persici TaxID=1076596 RepID=A0A6V8I675_9PROT|nr:hypothetical protein [Acetobacter persici]GFE93079.1 hypothetical protein DmAi_11380 [Acetobacter persici]